jgi:hypothetical protein
MAATVKTSHWVMPKAGLLSGRTPEGGWLLDMVKIHWLAEN